MNGEPSRGQSPDIEKDGADSLDKEKLSKQEHNIATRETDAEDDSSDTESESLLDEILQDPIDSGELRTTLQKRIQNAPNRVLQQMEYTRLMEDRIGDLEKRMREIENKGREPEPPTLEMKIQPTHSILGLKRMTFQEYLPTNPDQGTKAGASLRVEHKRRHEFPGLGPYHLIDVVIGATHQPERLGGVQSTKSPTNSPDPSNPGLATPAQDPTTSDGQFVQPERIRINSSLLLDALEKITGLAFIRSLDDKRQWDSQVILRPFKLLVTYEQEIRNEVARLEKIHMPDDNGNKAKSPETSKSEGQSPPLQPLTDTLHPTAESSSQNHPGDLKDNKNPNTTIDASIGGKTEDVTLLGSKRCLEELRVLIELLDKDLKPTFDLRKQIKDGVARSIAFQDLWHLFPLGGEILHNDPHGHNQINRILDVCGGKPFLCSKREANMETPESTSNGRDLPKFEILSYYYNSDGRFVGACEELIKIKWYDGNKAITSLPCYPIIYAKKSRDFFIERGKRLIDLARRTDVVHKRYDGLTVAVDEIREEVRHPLNTSRATD